MKWWQTRWAKALAVVAVAFIGVIALVYLDVVSRAKESYLEAEKYMEWQRHPEQKKKFFDDAYEVGKMKLDAELSKGKLSQPDYQLKLDALAFDRDFRINESSLKYAYQWYKDTYELFSPPESDWVKKARVKAPEALELWKKELNEKKIPFEDTMFE